jgi:Methyltransferase domain
MVEAKHIDVATITAAAADIEGMMLAESVAIWHAILQTQHSSWSWVSQRPGPYLEIGTFKGKSASILAHYALAYGNGVAVVDPVLGDDVKFRLKEIYPAIVFHEFRSEYLRISEFYRQCFRSCAFIHIDGMHTFSAISEDLRLSEDLLGYFGVVCIDDFHSNLYPQIPAAVYRHLYSGNSDLSLFLVGFNKAYLCRNEGKRFFHACVRDNFVQQLSIIGHNFTLVKTDRHDLFDAFALDYCDPAVAGNPSK